MIRYGTINDDVIYGGPHRDYLLSSPGNDQLYGRHGDDTVLDNEGWNFLSGGYGNDYVQGTGTLVGNRGDDYVVVEAGSGFGGPGNDHLIANSQIKYDGTSTTHDAVLQGGAGIDQFFAYTYGTDANPSRVDILDFKQGEDQVTVFSSETGTPFSHDAKSDLDLNHDHHLNATDGLLVDQDGLHLRLGNDEVVLHGSADFMF